MVSDQLAAVTKNGEISLFDPLSGKELARWDTKQTRIGCLAFSPDGARLASAGGDTTALIWDVAARLPAPAKAQLKDEDLPRLCAELLKPDAGTACRAARQLIQAPAATVAFLDKQLPPAPPIADGKIKMLVTQLDSPRIAERDRAARELLELADLAESALELAAKNPPSQEAKVRITTLLAEARQIKAKGMWPLSGESLRDWRAVEVLERIGTPQAQSLLKRLGQGAGHAVLTRQAQQAAQRLTK